MALLPWIAAAFLVAALAGSATLLVVGGLRAWRSFKSLSRRTTTALDEVTATAATAEAHAVRLSDGSERLTSAVERLQRSLAELALLRAALSEARAPIARARGLVPRK
jgi:hypothetical protein